MDFILAFAAGLLSFLSPCVLPLIPAYFSYMVGSSVADIRTSRQKINALLIENLSVFLRKIARFLPVISVVSGIVVIVMGVLVFTNRLEVFSQYGSIFNI